MVSKADSVQPFPPPTSFKFSFDSQLEKTKEFRFKWTVENVSMSIQKRWEAVESPRFKVEDSVETGWFLKLYPKGRSDANHMACYVQREIGSQQTSDLTSFTLSYLNDDGTLKEAGKFLNEDFSDFGSTHWGTDYFKPIGDVCNKVLDGKEDILTVCCHMWWYQGTKCPLIQCSARTRIKIERYSFVWDLPGVRKSSSPRKPPVGESKIKIPMISQSLASSFGLELQFDHKTNKSGCYEWAGCIYCLVTETREKPIFSKLKIRTMKNEASEYGASMFQPLTSQQKVFFFHVPGKNHFNRGWFSGDYKLNLICDLIISVGEELKQIEETKYDLPYTEMFSRKKLEFKPFPPFFDIKAQTVPKGERAGSNVSSSKLTANQSTMTDGAAFAEIKSPLKDDLLLFYSNKTLCDAYLLVKGDKLCAHKAVLAARSPVLCDIIKQNEKASIIEIEDISNSNPATLINFMRYLYADEVKDLQAGSALQLYFCAEKYQVRDLQTKCFQFLKTSSSLVGICDLFSFEDELCKDVKDLALKFFVANAKEVFNSEEWEQATMEKSSVVVKLMTLVCVNLSQGST